MSTADAVIISQLVLSVLGFFFVLEIRKLRKILERKFK